MAIYRFEAKVIGRSAGRSATASAAYRAGEAVTDERTGQAFDYSHRRGVLHSEIMAPADAPEWMRDRAQLWNAVEKAEKRKDAQLSREVLLSLPHELTHTQRVDLVREFVGAEFVGHGMIADIAMHAPHRSGDDRNYHVHAMLTMRELAGDGFGKKVRDWNTTEQLEAWREHWAVSVNRHLEQHGHAARVDHRSLEEQGIDREPEPKQGPVATEMEREGRGSHAGDDRRAVQARNQERAATEAAHSKVTAEIIDLQAARAKRAGEAEDDPERNQQRTIVATDDGGMVAQQREALRQAALRTNRRGDRREPQRERDSGRDRATSLDERARRSPEKSNQDDTPGQGTTTAKDEQDTAAAVGSIETTDDKTVEVTRSFTNPDRTGRPSGGGRRRGRTR